MIAHEEDDDNMAMSKIQYSLRNIWFKPILKDLRVEDNWLNSALPNIPPNEVCIIILFIFIRILYLKGSSSILTDGLNLIH